MQVAAGSVRNPSAAPLIEHCVMCGHESTHVCSKPCPHPNRVCCRPDRSCPTKPDTHAACPPCRRPSCAHIQGHNTCQHSLPAGCNTAAAAALPALRNDIHCMPCSFLPCQQPCVSLPCCPLPAATPSPACSTPKHTTCCAAHGLLLVLGKTLQAGLQLNIKRQRRHCTPVWLRQ
jgi:hypothetical protein